MKNLVILILSKLYIFNGTSILGEKCVAYTKITLIILLFSIVITAVCLKLILNNDALESDGDKSIIENKFSDR